MHLINCLTLLSVLGFIKCDFPTIEIDVENEDEKVVLVTALFTKINWMMMEIEKINKNMNIINERLNSQKEDENINLQLLKTGIRELNQTIKLDGIEMQQQLLKKLKEDENINLQQLKTEIKELKQTIKNDGMEMQQQLFEKIDLQENLITKSSKDIERFNTTINKILQIQPLKQMGNWLVILRRQDGSVNFNRNWLDYKNGFGNPNGEYFIGLDKLHAITTYGERQELLIVLQDFDNNTRYAKYDDFVVGNGTEKYILKKLGVFSGDAGDSLISHLNYPFSTKDQFNGNDIIFKTCAPYFKGGWWFEKCYRSHLAGPYFHQPKSNTDNGVNWNSWHGEKYSLKFVEMMLRPKSY